MEPTTILIFGNLFYKVLSTGVDVARNDNGIWEVGDLGALKGVLETLQGLIDAREKTKKNPKLVLREAQFVVASFAEALRQHWGAGSAMVKGQGLLNRMFQGSEDQARIERVQLLLGRLPSALGKATPFEDPIQADPIAHPGFVCLWDAFTASSTDVAPLLEPGGGEGRRAFEQSFRRAWRVLMASPQGHELRELWLGEQKDLPHACRALLLMDIATWGERHLFGGGEHHPYLPFLPMKELYVEPLAIQQDVRGQNVGGPRPAREAIRDLLEDHPIVLVVADFGHGKSLTARMLANAWADTWLTATRMSSTELEYPIFVRCADDMREDVNPTDIQKRALHRHAGSIHIQRKLTHPMFQPPGSEQRVITLLDGLDEVLLSEKQRCDLLVHLQEEATDRHRFVIFTRPGVLPAPEYRKDIPVLRIQEFTPEQIDTWLIAWNSQMGTVLAQKTLQERGLAELARTPILLFMIAYGDGRVTPSSGEPPIESIATIYERFFQQMARGKHEADVNAHNKSVTAAAESLKGTLVEKGELEQEASPEEAMLWLMGRVAWEGERLSVQKKELDSYYVIKIVRDELNCNAEIATTIQVGLLLAIQADLTGSNNRILFGHKSFREFLVARHWAGRLKRIIQLQKKGGCSLEKQLYGARLLEQEARSLKFLMEILNSWSDNDRVKVREWADRTFNDESLDCLDEPVTLHKDQRLYLREAAIAIGSLIQGGGLTCKKHWILQDLLSRFNVRDEDMSLFANNVVAVVANLRGANLRGANLQGANLQGADLQGANLIEANLIEANLQSAYLQGAYLRGAYLRGANLRGANLQSAYLQGAYLRGANLRGAYLIGAYLQRANLRGANLQDADLQDANLQDTNLQDANLQGADLRGANLEGVRGLNEAALTDLLLRTTPQSS